MASIVVVEDLPYDYAYRRFPFGGYNSSFPERWSGDGSTYYDTLMYGDNIYPTFVVGAPFTGHASLAKKRKLDGLKGEVILPGGHNVRNICVASDSKSSTSPPLSKSMGSSTVSSGEATKDAHVYEPPQGNATPSNRSFVSSVSEMSAHPRVISIPVTSTNDGKDSCVKCTVVPQKGTKKSRKAVVSSDGAAILIQAWFRGYQVRKTKPLTQMRCIAEVKLQLADLEEKASDADYMNYVRENMAGRAKLTEGIMNLLLQLDSIQGAHPAVREIRKVTTKKVISLQGRVDDLLTTEETLSERSQLPLEVEEASRDKVNWELLPATESGANDSVTMEVVDVEAKEAPCDSNVEEQASIVHTSLRFENDMTNAALGTQLTAANSDQGNGEVGALPEFEAREADILEFKNGYTMSTQMAEPDQDEGNGEIVAAECGPEPMDLESSKADVEGINKGVASDMGGDEIQTEHSSEAHAQHDIAFENEPSSELRNDDGKNMEVGFDCAETMAWAAEQIEAETEKRNVSAEQAVHSSDTPEVSRQGNLESNEEEDRKQFDYRTNENGPNATAELTDDGGVVEAETEKRNASAEQAVQSGDIREVSRQGNLESNEEEDRERFDDRANENGPNATGELIDGGGVVEAEIEKMNASAEQAVQSEVSRQNNLESNEDEDRGQFDDRANENGPNANGDLTDDGGNVRTLIAKHYLSPLDSTLPYSPRSPLEAQSCLDCSLYSSDNELPSDSQGSPKIVHEALPADNQALLLKLAEENKALKSLLVTIMKWNQMHAIATQDVDQRLRNLEGRLSPRSGKKKLNSRRRVGKSNRMMLQ